MNVSRAGPLQVVPSAVKVVKETSKKQEKAILRFTESKTANQRVKSANGYGSKKKGTNLDLYA